jgi:hypothetical protein
MVPERLAAIQKSVGFAWPGAILITPRVTWGGYGFPHVSHRTHQQGNDGR